MKHFLFVFVSLIIVAGCGTKTKDPQLEQYAVQLVEIAVPAALLEDTWAKQVWATDPSYFQTETVKDDSTQYIGVKRLAAQSWVFEDVQTMYTDVKVVSSAVEKMMESPKIKITEFPEINLTVGEQFINDQTKITELPFDYEVVDGKTVVTNTESFRYGQSVDIQLIEADDSMAIYNLDLYIGRLKGVDTYTLSNGDEAEIQLAECTSSYTQYAQPFNTWNIVGGLVHEQIEGGETNKVSHLLCIRVISPTSTD